MTLFGTGFDMSLAEQNKIVDEWAAKRKKRVGVVRIPQVGE